MKKILIFLILSSFTSASFAADLVDNSSIFSNPGVIITVTLILIPLLIAVYLAATKLSALVKRASTKKVKEDSIAFKESLDSIANANQLIDKLNQRKEAISFHLTGNELSGDLIPTDKKGLIYQVNEVITPRYVSSKKKADKRPKIDENLSKLIIWHIITSTFWLVLGTSIGEYLGLKFIAPDVDHISWLSFGRLRPVHTNMVFWGWCSLAMIGLGYYVVYRVSNSTIKNFKSAWYALILINLAVFIGSISLMAGINNGGGEYREYIWPIMLLFAIGAIITLINYLKIISQRKVKEIYVSNWYIVSSVIFVIVIALVAYLPFWQNGLGETIAQGYYMHQGVGMWFMLFTLGLVYYFLPQQLNKPIYSYSLGILAFWTQILFYTVIGTHHFIFSAIPWWLQTTAIIGSMGMLIPVAAGTTNFLMTMKGDFHKIGYSYTLPFYLIGIIFYFTGSFQGTAEAFRSANLYWHFTDFTVAHSHLTMYGIITFFLWAFIYTLVPRLTGKEPKQSLVGAHFWMAFIGLMFYSIPLMIGSTLRGISWQEGQPFIDSVVNMAPYWLWRAIGGSLMWFSHLIFAFNLYDMLARPEQPNIQSALFESLKIPKEN